MEKPPQLLPEETKHDPRKSREYTHLDFLNFKKA